MVGASHLQSLFAHHLRLSLQPRIIIDLLTFELQCGLYASLLLLHHMPRFMWQVLCLTRSHVNIRTLRVRQCLYLSWFGGIVMDVHIIHGQAREGFNPSFQVIRHASAVFLLPGVSSELRWRFASGQCSLEQRIIFQVFLPLQRFHHALKQLLVVETLPLDRLGLGLHLELFLLDPLLPSYSRAEPALPLLSLNHLSWTVMNGTKIRHI